MIDQNIQNKDDLDVKEIWRVVRSFRRAIAIIFILIISFTFYLTMTTKSLWQSTTVVMIKESNTNPGALVFDFGMSGAGQRLTNEIELLNSYNIHDQAVQSLIEDGSADEMDLFGTRYVKRRYRLWDYFLNWVKRSEVTLVHPSNMTYAQRIGVVENLRASTEIISPRDADILKISVTSPDSAEAIFLANRISNIYRNIDIAGGQGELHFVLTFLDSQITKYSDRLMVAEDGLKDFQIEHEIYSLDGSATILLEELTKYESIYFTNIAEYEVALERVKYLKGQLSDSELALMDEITNTNNPMIVALRGKIAELEAQKVQQMVDEGWNDESLQGKDYNRRIAEMKSKLTSITESLILSGWSEEDPFEASQAIFNKIVEQEVEVHAARSRADEYKKLVDHISRQLDSLPVNTLNYARIERELRLSESLYLTMKQKYEESRITEAGQRGKVRILDPALISVRIKPNKKLNLFIGVALGLGLGLAYAFIREMLDNTIKAVEQLERKGLTVLGIIPDMHHKVGIRYNLTKSSQPSKGGTDFKRRLITYEDPKSPISESYRSLRTNITYSSSDKKKISFIVTSPQPGEGKSTTVANLAIAFAQLRKRTLLIDAELRKPAQHNVFGLSRGPGLSEYLIGDTEDFNLLVHKTKVQSLHIVTAGGLPPNPSELLGSSRMSDLVAKLEQEWDIILFDSPPIVAVTDASMISGEIDGLILVVKAGSTDRSAVDRALDTITNVKAPLIGVILNGASPETLAGKYSYYYSYYNYYYSAEDGNKKSKNLKHKK